MTEVEAAEERGRYIREIGMALERADRALMEMRALWFGLRDLERREGLYAEEASD